MTGFMLLFLSAIDEGEVGQARHRASHAHMHMRETLAAMAGIDCDEGADFRADLFRTENIGLVICQPSHQMARCRSPERKPLGEETMGREADADVCVIDLSAAEIFATGVELPEFCGDFVRIVFYSDRVPSHGPTERSIVAKIILPFAVLIERIAAYQGAVSDHTGERKRLMS